MFTRGAILIAGACGLGFVATTVVSLLVPREPMYQGKRLKEWLISAEQESNSQVQEKCAKAVRAMGTNAIPTLLWMLQKKDSPMVLKVKDFAKHYLHFSIPGTPDSVLHSRALFGLWALETDARPALPVLVNLVTNQEIAFGITSVLGVTGPDAVPALIGAMTNADQKVRTIAESGLRHYATSQEATLAVPELVKRLKHPDDFVRAASANVLGEMHQQPCVVVPELTCLLVDNDTKVRESAVFALRKYGPSATSAIPALEKLLSEHNPSIGSRAWASNTILAIAPDYFNDTKPQKP